MKRYIIFGSLILLILTVGFANNVYGSPADYIKWHHDLYSKLPPMSQERAKLLAGVRASGGPSG